MTRGFSSAGKLAVLAVAVAAAVAMPLSASARGWGGHGGHGGHHGYHGGYHGGNYHRGGHWSGGRWIAGAIVTGAVIGLVNQAVRPAPAYYDYGTPVYNRPRTVIYEDGPPIVRRRVVETRTGVYDDPYQTRYIRDDGYDGD